MNSTNSEVAPSVTFLSSSSAKHFFVKPGNASNALAITFFVSCSITARLSASIFPSSDSTAAMNWLQPAFGWFSLFTWCLNWSEICLYHKPLHINGVYVQEKYDSLTRIQSIIFQTKLCSWFVPSISLRSGGIQASVLPAKSSGGMHASVLPAKSSGGMQASVLPAKRSGGMQASVLPAKSSGGMQASVLPAKSRGGMHASVVPRKSRGGMQPWAFAAKSARHLKSFIFYFLIIFSWNKVPVNSF